MGFQVVTNNVRIPSNAISINKAHLSLPRVIRLEDDFLDTNKFAYMTLYVDLNERKIALDLTEDKQDNSYVISDMKATPNRRLVSCSKRVIEMINPQKNPSLVKGIVGKFVPTLKDIPGPDGKNRKMIVIDLMKKQQ